MRLFPRQWCGSRCRWSNRHGLIAGATGTGKTKTLQVLSEQLSAAGVAVFAADMKGEFLSLGGIGPGVPVRATVSDFGPQLLAKVLEANETQEQSLALVFRFADEPTSSSASPSSR